MPRQPYYEAIRPPLGWCPKLKQGSHTVIIFTEMDDNNEGIRWVNPDCPPEVAGGFMSYVEEWESAPLTTIYKELEKRGWTPRPPDEVPDEEIEEAVLEFAHRLLGIRVLLEDTDHLSDRELYERVYEMSLEENKLFPDDMDGIHHYDMCNGETENYLRYYSDDDWRDYWHEQFPDEIIPPKELPPYPRAHKLPQDDRPARRRLDAD